jgi:hypothetical protein
MSIKEAAYRVALKHVEAIEWEEKLPAGKITKEHEDNFDKVLDKVNKKQISNANDFYSQLEDIGIDKVMLRDLVVRVISKGNSEDIVKMVFLLGEGKPMGDKSHGKGLKILTESWVKRQLDDGELTRKVKPKFWPLFRDKAWLDKENKGSEKEKEIDKEKFWTTRNRREMEEEKKQRNLQK